jgi:hypothetical protein
MPKAVDIVIADEAAVVDAADDTMFDSISNCNSHSV